jgi:small ligand-binding sensory domain FIST
VYHKGELLTDAAVALSLSGEFTIAMAGRQAKDNDQVIATASEAVQQALAKLKQQNAQPAACLAFDCAGRKGKLKNVADELAAMQTALGKSLALYGTYNAGEIGPADVSEAKPGVLSCGVGWHVMVTAIGW